jgi:hypothetical protein
MLEQFLSGQALIGCLVLIYRRLHPSRGAQPTEGCHCLSCYCEEPNKITRIAGRAHKGT